MSQVHPTAIVDPRAKLGEGVTVGTPSAFVRLQGCSVGCAWCDTKYSWASTGGRETTLDALLAEVTSTGLDNVVVTGGEPLEHPAFVALVDGLTGKFAGKVDRGEKPISLDSLAHLARARSAFSSPTLRASRIWSDTLAAGGRWLS